MIFPMKQLQRGKGKGKIGRALERGGERGKLDARKTRGAIVLISCLCRFWKIMIVSSVLLEQRMKDSKLKNRTEIFPSPFPFLAPATQATSN